jgi:hypothetical protein
VAEIRHRREQAETQVARIDALIGWQTSLVTRLRLGRRAGVDKAEEIIAVLAETRAWYVEAAALAQRDLNFIKRTALARLAPHVKWKP